MDENISKSELERQARVSEARKRKLKKVVVWIIILAILAGAVYGLVVWSKTATANKPGMAIPELGQGHIAVGTVHEPYNSNPPTSGPHYERWADWGFFDRELPDEQLVHNLEHGGIWISYKDKDQALVDELKYFTDKYSLKVIVTHRPQNDTPISVAAWGRLMNMEAFDKDQIQKFINAFINQGPEDVPY